MRLLATILIALGVATFALCAWLIAYSAWEDAVFGNSAWPNAALLMTAAIGGTTSIVVGLWLRRPSAP